MFIEKIKRCPYCGSSAHLYVDWNSKKVNGLYGQYVSCTQCTCKTYTSPTSEQAIQQWNERSLKEYKQLKLF